MGDEHTLLLGEIKGKLDSLQSTVKDTNIKIDGLDTRLRDVEKRATLHGALSGGVMAIGVSLLIESLKKKVGL